MLESYKPPRQTAAVLRRSARGGGRNSVTDVQTFPIKTPPGYKLVIISTKVITTGNNIPISHPDESKTHGHRLHQSNRLRILDSAIPRGCHSSQKQNVR